MAAVKEIEKKFVVEVIEYATGKVVNASKPMSERKADVVDRGKNRNLNHDLFFTSISPFKESKK